jgi:hypothetical protein
MATPFRNNTRSEKCGTSALGDKSKINLSTLHIKLGLIEISVKAMEKYSKGFAYLRQTFPKISDTEMKEEIFLWSTNYTTIRRPVLQYRIKFYRRKSLEGI